MNAKNIEPDGCTNTYPIVRPGKTGMLCELVMCEARFRTWLKRADVVILRDRLNAALDEMPLYDKDSDSAAVVRKQVADEWEKAKPPNDRLQ